MINFIGLGKKIYDLNNPREAHRFAVFVARCCLHPQRINRLEEFFSQSEILKDISKKFPFVYEQVTRAFFYHKSKFDERMNLIKSHMNFFTQNMSENFLRRLYGGERIELWKMLIDENLGEMRLLICIEPGQRKEGLASVMLRLNDDFPIYQIMFWIAPDNLLNFENSTGNPAMWIGAMQGPNVDDAKEIIKLITKKTHAYRTKNLILYATQAVARSLGLKKIFAVTNYGYYANNHVRKDRKLKTSFSDFWNECGGTPTNDKRFFELPIVEQRKNFEEIPAHKRAVYRRRFTLLDEIDSAVETEIEKIFLNPPKIQA
ncbi:MAG: DUF535 domain-containing protein [Selenomonadaceae bacterium]|nr:DUF535 domain-containing protein [Selenomonadaceae bacterium]